MAESTGQVVVGVDADADAPTTAVIAAGAREATRLHLGLLLVHPLPASPPWLVGIEPPRAGGAPQLAQRLLDHLVEKTAAAHPGVVVHGILRSGSPAGALLAGSANAALILVAADARIRYGGLLAGPVTTQVAAHARTSVIVVPTSERRRPAGPAKVVVGIDGSRGSAEAVAFAFLQARARTAHLHAIHVWESSSWHGVTPNLMPAFTTGPLHTAADEMLREATVGGESTYPDVTVVREVLYGDNPVHALNNAAADADIVVVGARGGGGFGSLLLGSISDGLVRYATRTVVVVRDGRSPDRAERPGVGGSVGTESARQIGLY
ncbi:universal stress protein [Micromonospora profundi]|uniref:Universal stress protein n=1 Tax=Micromonospora profundi TaxID=1420889 RepID=A0AAJ6L0H3_9ACTN|nr:universal stress protein [Micromonospora profundi]WLS43320.1 universal stress protein [Micromonospora profundi]